MTHVDKENIIKNLKINKLFGYKDVTINFNSSGPVILLAENGSGKTTVMKVLAYLLSGKYFSLNEIEFSDLEITLNQDGKKFKISKGDIGKIVDFYKKELKDEFNVITKLDIDADDFVHFVTSVYNPNSFDKYIEHPIVSKLYEATPFNWDNIKKFLNKSHSFFKKNNEKKIKLKFDRSLLDFYLKEYDVVYLPTFRRIESKLSINEINPFISTESIISKFESNQMYFNLDDIEKKLNESLSSIIDISKDAISNAIIHSLTNKKNAVIKLDNDKENLLSFEKTLKRISLKKDDYKKEISSDINTEILGENSISFYKKDEFFNYFLNNTIDSLKDSEDIEKNILNYIETINKFLILSGDKKKFVFDREKLHVKLYLIDETDSKTLKEISMNSLSSGEKQIVSMFAPLFLSKKKKIFLIDEPEISLSIKWQELLLPEIYNSRLCGQLFAITHSPFTFSNCLEDYAIGMEAKNNSSNSNE